jgi:diaminobutyrate-2-oxoglutarate transaminase
MGIFEDRESAVVLLSYCRTWPKVFDRASGSWLYDEDGDTYLEFSPGPALLITATTTWHSGERYWSTLVRR